MSKQDIEEIVKYVKENVWMYDQRCEVAGEIMDKYRCPLEYADGGLWSDIEDAVRDWCDDNGKCFDDYDLEEIFY